ncbi:hypothetical protein BH11ARM1_BH11ARM1_08230 [soil metagenome]
MRREDLLDLNDVLQHPGRRLAVDISTELAEEEDIDLIQPLEGFIEAVSTGNLLLIVGEFKTKAIFECSRCTGPVELDIAFEVDEQFPVDGTPSSMNPQDVAKVAPDEPYEMFDGNSLMVEQLLRQAFHLSVPLQPLCPFGWDGGCPQAAERAEVAQMAIEDHPLDKLAKFLHEDLKD